MKLLEKIKTAFKSGRALRFTQTVADLIKKINWHRIAVVAVCLAVIASSALIAVLTISVSIRAKTDPSIIKIEDADGIQNIDYIVILGAGLRSDGYPSDMLADRLTVGVALLEHHPEAKLVLTGDNSGEHYNEVAAMKKYVTELGVKEESIIEDGKGYSTYESLYYVKNGLDAQNIIIVTQRYHLHRALYIADQFGIEAAGVSADLRSYRRRNYRMIREHFARAKDFFFALTEHTPSSISNESEA